VRVVVNGQYFDWPAGWPLPRAGEEVILGDERWIVDQIEFRPPMALSVPKVTSSGYPSYSAFGTDACIVLVVSPPAPWDPNKSGISIQEGKTDGSSPS